MLLKSYHRGASTNTYVLALETAFFIVQFSFLDLGPGSHIWLHQVQDDEPLTYSELIHFAPIFQFSKGKPMAVIPFNETKTSNWHMSYIFHEQ